MKTEKRKAIKKLERAIDYLIAVQDLGQGCEAVSRALESLNHTVARLNYEVSK